MYIILWKTSVRFRYGEVSKSDEQVVLHNFLSMSSRMKCHFSPSTYREIRFHFFFANFKLENGGNKKSRTLIYNEKYGPGNFRRGFQIGGESKYLIALNTIRWNNERNYLPFPPIDRLRMICTTRINNLYLPRLRFVNGQLK